MLLEKTLQDEFLNGVMLHTYIDYFTTESSSQLNTAMRRLIEFTKQRSITIYLILQNSEKKDKKLNGTAIV